MFNTYVLPKAEPVKVFGHPYGLSLALPEFIGRGAFTAGPDETPSQDELDRQCWETDGGPCEGER